MINDVDCMNHLCFQFDSISFGSEFPKCTEMETHRVKGKAKTITIDFLFDYKGKPTLQEPNHLIASWSPLIMLDLPIFSVERLTRLLTLFLFSNRRLWYSNFLVGCIEWCQVGMRVWTVWNSWSCGQVSPFYLSMSFNIVSWHGTKPMHTAQCIFHYSELRFFQESVPVETRFSALETWQMQCR